MKTYLMVVFVFSYLNCTAQTTRTEQAHLQVVKNSASAPVTLTIKPHKRIKIKVPNSKRWHTLPTYTLLGDSALATPTDTVRLKDITAIKANVKGNVLRKASGVILTSGGALFTGGFMGVGMVTLLTGLSPYALLALPGLAVTQAGLSLTGARRFNTQGKWNLTVSPE